MLEEIEKLIGQVALEDRRALSKLYDRTSAKLFGVCLRILKERTIARTRCKTPLSKSGATPTATPQMG